MNAILSSSFLIRFRMMWSPIVSKNFSRCSRFPEKGVIFPPLTSVVFSLVASVIFSVIVFAVVFGFGSGSGFLCSSKASKNRSAGALSSDVVWKLSSVSVGSVVRGSGVGVFLHSCSSCLRVDVVGRGMLGSPTTLRERGPSSSESLSVGSVNHPCRLAVFRFSWVLLPKMEQGFG